MDKFYTDKFFTMTSGGGRVAKLKFDLMSRISPEELGMTIKRTWNIISKNEGVSLKDITGTLAVVEVKELTDKNEAPYIRVYSSLDYSINGEVGVFHDVVSVMLSRQLSRSHAKKPLEEVVY